MKRQPEALADRTFDLLVLGGGITGAGVALDAVTRGLRVALIDKGDFASGTSSASSKLVHGGLRYLERGDFALVYEALQERRLLLHNAPHLVRPLRFVLPFYRGWRVKPWQWRVALALYDLLAGAGNLRRNHGLRTPRLLRESPGLRSDGLRDGAEYYDAQMDDARLCVEVLKTAASAGAVVANYVEAVAFEKADGVVTGVRAVDRVGGGELAVRARVVLNATGPWLDAVCKLAGDEGGPRLQPSKGVHVLAPDRGLAAAFLLLHPDDGRVFFVIPWLGKSLIGTTDTFTPESPDELHVTPADVEYLLKGFNHYFEPGLGEGDLLGSFAGLRPLLRSRPGEPSALTREFHVFDSPSGLISVGGGKYTTYRHMAEVITDRVVKRLGRRRHCRTRGVRLDGAPTVAWKEFAPAEIAFLRSRHGLDDRTARHLVDRYGRRARDVAGLLDRDPSLAQPIVEGEPDLRAEVVYQREHEMAVRPEDHLLRRTRLGLYCPGVGVKTLSFLAVLLLFVLPWAARGENWPGWRGPAGNGVSSESPLPVEWDRKHGVRWSAEVPGDGFSSPAVWEDRVYLTASKDRGSLRLVHCFERATGKLLWTGEVADKDPEATSAVTGHAASTPATDGEHVVAFFGNAGVVCFDRDGKRLWRRELGPFDTELGLASSPLVRDGRVFLVCDHDGDRFRTFDSFLLALDVKTGKELWKADRPGLGRSWSSPLLIAPEKGTPELVVAGEEAVRAYDPATGEERWRVSGLTSWVAPTPVFGGGLLFVTSGRNGPVLAVRPGGKGDVTKTHVAWRHETGGPYVTSPLVLGDHLYTIHEQGLLTCYEAETGKQRYRERLEGKFTASPVGGDGKLYVTNEDGLTFVVRAGPKFEVVARNALEEFTQASPAIAGRELFLRTERRLFCVGAD